MSDLCVIDSKGDVIDADDLLAANLSGQNIPGRRFGLTNTLLSSGLLQPPGTQEHDHPGDADQPNDCITDLPR